jgi:hypothetical protein
MLGHCIDTFDEDSRRGMGEFAIVVHKLTPPRITEAKAIAELPADELKRLIQDRTGIASRELVCPRAKSDMTPCVARDGNLAVAVKFSQEVCVGCEWGVFGLLESERICT